MDLDACLLSDCLNDFPKGYIVELDAEPIVFQNDGRYLFWNFRSRSNVRQWLAGLRIWRGRLGMASFPSQYEEDQRKKYDREPRVSHKTI